MTEVDYRRTLVDCPSLGLEGISLRKVEQLVQNTWETTSPIAFVLHRSDDGHLTVTDSLLLTAK